MSNIPTWKLKLINIVLYLGKVDKVKEHKSDVFWLEKNIV